MPTKIIVPTSVVGTGISVNTITPIITVTPPNCPRTDISQSKSNSLLRDVYVLISSNYPPQTIVNYVCAEVGYPNSASNNWCFLNCVSATLFKNVTYTPPNTFAYINKPQTFAKVTNCFPEFPLEAGGLGGGSSSKNRPDLETLLREKVQQINDVLNMMNYTKDDLQSLLNDLIANFGNTLTSFLARIAMAAEHLAEIISADITKHIGAAIAWIAKIWKTARDMTDAITNYALTTGESKTDNGGSTVGHLKKAIQDAMSTLYGFVTDVMKDAGQYMEQVGEFLYDVADQMIDLKDIAFMFHELATMTSHFNFTISWTFNRMLDTLKAQTYGKDSLTGLYDAQSSLAGALNLAKTELSMALAIQEDCSNALTNLNLLKMDLKAIPAEIKLLIADEKAAFANLKSSNAAYLAYAKSLISTDLSTIKSLFKISATAKSNLCSSRNNQQDPQLITAVPLPHIPFTGVPIT